MRESRFLWGVFMLLVVGFVGVFWWRAIRGGSGFAIDKSSPAVVTQLKKLSRYEAASFTIEKIIDAGTEDEGIRQFLFGDRILLIAHGKVIAGFDLSQMENRDVTIEGERLSITLPEPEILVTTLDNQKTRVYDREQGILSAGERDLEAEARRAAEAEIRAAACEGGILNEASENAKEQLSSLLVTLGFREVLITVPEGSCQ